MTSRQITDSRHETAPPDPRELDTALRCGPHSAAVLRALVSGDWREVDRLEVPELTAQVDGWAA